MSKDPLKNSGVRFDRRQMLKEICGGGLVMVFPGLVATACTRDDDSAQNSGGVAGEGGTAPRTDPNTTSAGGTRLRSAVTTTESEGGITGESQGASSSSTGSGGYQQSISSRTTTARGGASSSRDTESATRALGGNTRSSTGSASAGRGGKVEPSGGATQTGGTSSDSTATTGDGGSGPRTTSSGGSNSNASGGANTGGGTYVPNFDDAASCKLTTTDIEGPFYIDEAEFPDDASLVRSDIREGLSGCEFRLYLRLLNARQSCAPIPSAEIYIWHCNADGYYSGFDGQDPTTPYTGAAERTPDNMDRFCRGVQSSDARGVVSFTTIYPGWYAGRPVHIHLMGRFKGATNRLITTQLYFPADATLDIHKSEAAYQSRVNAMPASSRTPPSGTPAMPTMTHTPGLVIGTLNVIVTSA